MDSISSTPEIQKKTVSEFVGIDIEARPIGERSAGSSQWEEVYVEVDESGTENYMEEVGMEEQEEMVTDEVAEIEVFTTEYATETETEEIEIEIELVESEEIEADQEESITESEVIERSQPISAAKQPIHQSLEHPYNEEKIATPSPVRNRFETFEEVKDKRSKLEQMRKKA